MKKVLFGIFAHPDDEAFGPCGTLIREVRDGTDLHLITLTYGGAGQNPDGLPDLAKVREGEWRASGAKIGAKSMHALSLPDGHLDNIVMETIDGEIESYIHSLIELYEEPIEVEFITFEPNGLTGHIDHIVAARVASFAFYRLKDTGLPLTRIRYYCNSEEKAPLHNTDWIYADKGYSPHEINEIVDARELCQEIVAVMRLHETQRADCEHYLSFQGDQLGLDHYIVKN